MTRRKRKSDVEVTIQLPLAALVFYEGMAQETGLKVADLLAVVLAMDAVRRRGKPDGA